MSRSPVSKVMKYELTYIDGCGTFHEMQENLWRLQRETREILNRTVQEAFHWDYKNREYHAETGEYMNLQDTTGYKTIDGYIYNILKSDYTDISTANLNATVRKACSKYNTSKKEILKGVMSLPSYKSDQPLIIYPNNIKLLENAGKECAKITLFSDYYKKTNNVSNVCFEIKIKDNTQKNIFGNIKNKTYRLGQCQLVYKRPKWFLFITYIFVPEELELDKERILGIDLGECVAIYASIFGEYGALEIKGGEVKEFANKLEARIKSMQKQARYCGEGRIGHGTKTRVSNVYRSEDKIAAFRDTINHRYSKKLIAYAVEKGCGTIQMEDLTGIKSDTGFPKFLRHWTYYDLQTKIEYKAKEKGIDVVKIDPRNTSRRCSRCGNIDKKNRPDQATFCCTQCGYKANADYNASQNISIKGIDKIIKKTKIANPEET